MKLSIITVNLNNRDGLKRTIDSVVSQTFTDYEWIVIDGGSTDGSRELIEQYSDLFAYWCSEPDKGIYNAMNKGIAHAKGEWLQFLNCGDCLFEKDTLKKVFSKTYEADIIYGDVIYVDSNSEGIVRTEFKPDKLTLFYFYHNTICHQASFYSKKIFLNYLYDDSFKICGDNAFNIKNLTNGYIFQHIPLYVVNFEVGGIGAVFTPEHINERERLFKEYIPEYLQDDMIILRNYDKKNNFYNSHRIYKYKLNIADKTILFVEKIVKLIEKIKIKLKE